MQKTLSLVVGAFLFIAGGVLFVSVFKGDGLAGSQTAQVAAAQGQSRASSADAAYKIALNYLKNPSFLKEFRQEQNKALAQLAPQVKQAMAGIKATADRKIAEAGNDAQEKSAVQKEYESAKREILNYQIAYRRGASEKLKALQNALALAAVSRKREIDSAYADYKKIVESASLEFTQKLDKMGPWALEVEDSGNWGPETPDVPYHENAANCVETYTGEGCN